MSWSPILKRCHTTLGQRCVTSQRRHQGSLDKVQFICTCNPSGVILCNPLTSSFLRLVEVLKSLRIIEKWPQSILKTHIERILERARYSLRRNEQGWVESWFLLLVMSVIVYICRKIRNSIYVLSKSSEFWLGYQQLLCKAELNISQTWTKSDQPLGPLQNNHRPGKVSLVGETHSVPGDEKNAPQRRICDENALWMFDVTDLRITGILGSSLQQLDEFSLTLRFQVFPAEFVIQRIDIYVIVWRSYYSCSTVV